GVSLADGADSTNRSILRDLRVSGATTGVSAGSFTTIENVSSTDNSNYGIALRAGEDLEIFNSRFDKNKSGMKIGSQVGFTGLVIADSAFDNNSGPGWYSDANSSIKP